MILGHVVGVLIRLFALRLLVGVLQITFTATSMGNVPPVDFWTVTSVALPLLIALFLWVFNLSVAKRLCYGTSYDHPLDLTGATHLENAMFSVFGLWLACFAVIDAAYWVFYFSTISSPEMVPYAISTEQKSRIAATVVQGCIGIFLLFRSRGLAKLIARFRG
jgi:hypothetical protein